jgi:hypothetical protein
MLENAVAPLTELHQVKINDNLEKTKNGRNLTYEEYRIPYSPLACCD